ncbi:hypothetical protein E3O53_07940 [Cryobacterium sp. TMT2-18-3]|uniref:hypothetical protein n=1 Tax=unclassified Cryobacterium TaxID=2649013 RepID=UPI00106C31EB|nr:MULTISPECIES: hypothetical protein [unclassified Cryobacterium]TFC26422.1 hypothetical protein E3O22_12370 [Cryobacterium sp. TMT2-18-2]TFC64400.1 hypothetical protein E3O53_07940 [Cryobacterium sp. TMT2-18-3]
MDKQTPEDYAEYLAWKQQRETGGTGDRTRPQNPNHEATLRATGTPARPPVGGWTTFDHFKASLGDEHARGVLGIKMNQALADQILSSETNAWAYYSGWRADQPTVQQAGARVSPPVAEQAAWAAARADLALRPTVTVDPGRTVGANPASAPAKKHDRFKSFKFGFGFAALFLLGFVSWGAQFVAASTFGITEYFRWDFRSTGGLIAVIAGIAMWAKCRSWESWRKWIWLPILITVTLAFIYMGSAAQTIAREEEILQKQELRQEEDARQAEIAQACEVLSQQIDAKASEIERSRSESVVKRPSWATSERPSWATAPTSGADELAVMEMRAEYDASC